MEIRYKTLEHGVEGEAPFIGARISAIGCKQKCKGCPIRKTLLKMPTFKKNVTEIISDIQSDPRNEGIILSHLEWSEQVDELLAIVETASSAGLQIMIHTGLDVIPFYERIGEHLYKSKVAKGELSENYTRWFFDGMFSTIGSSVLDYKTPNGYFLKFGAYDRGLLSNFDSPEAADSKEVYGVKLTSKNQNVVHIVGDEGIDNEHIG